MRFAHFAGNEVNYIFTLTALADIPLICIAIA